MTLTSPKRPLTSNGNTKASWFSYYAGYSGAFVEDVFKHLSLGSDTVLADPWNGAGTTTQIAHERGLTCRGFDINPAMVIVGKSRLLSGGVKPTHIRVAQRICELAAKEGERVEPEPLIDWFSPASATVLRSLERAVAQLLVTDKTISSLLCDSSSASLLACFFYVALFRTIRSFLRPFVGSNPTWIKIPADYRNRVRPTRDAVTAEFLTQVSHMGEAFGPVKPPATANVSIQVADSIALPLASESVDHFVTSPPYCTRIDYVVATRPELALLRIDGQTISQMRRAAIGSVLTAGAKPKTNTIWGRTCLNFLEAVKSHPSHASSSYYVNTHLLYFDKLFRSISEMARTLRRDGSCVMVVQDSFYKDVHNDLQSITMEMAASCGFSLTQRTDFRLSVTKAAMNSRHQHYRSGSTATESVLWFKKA